MIKENLDVPDEGKGPDESAFRDQRTGPPRKQGEKQSPQPWADDEATPGTNRSSPGKE